MSSSWCAARRAHFWCHSHNESPVEATKPDDVLDIFHIFSHIFLDEPSKISLQDLDLASRLLIDVPTLAIPGRHQETTKGFFFVGFTWISHGFWRDLYTGILHDFTVYNFMDDFQIYPPRLQALEQISVDFPEVRG